MAPWQVGQETWQAGAALHGVLGLASGAILIPLVNRMGVPALRALGLVKAEEA